MRVHAVRALVVPAALALLLSPGTSADGAQESQAAITISLESKLLPNTPPLGWSNIFFKAPDGTSIRVPRDWRDVQIADIVENPRFKPVYAVQYKDPAGTVQFAVDGDSDADLTNERPLAFEKAGDSLLADVAVRLLEKSGTPVGSPVMYQIMRAEKWVYARVREYRTGSIEIGGASYGLALRSKSRRTPLLGLADAALVIDQNRDGEMSPSEEVWMSQPFIVGGQKLEVVAIAAGSRLVLRPSLAETAVAIGFKAPKVEGSDLDGRRHALADLKGKVVLLEFWSIDCPHCGTIRPLVNRIVERVAGQDFAVLSSGRETDVAAVRDFLKTNPKSSIVVLRDEDAWKAFNPDGVTPLFFLVDRDGVIRSRFLGAGAATLKMMEDAVAGLVSRNPV